MFEHVNLNSRSVFMGDSKDIYCLEYINIAIIEYLLLSTRIEPLLASKQSEGDTIRGVPFRDLRYINILVVKNKHL